MRWVQGFASWFDVNEIPVLSSRHRLGGSVRVAQGQALTNTSARTNGSSNGSGGGGSSPVVVGVAGPTGSDPFSSSLCPTNGALFTSHMQETRRPHWSANFSVANVNASTRPLALMPPPRACTSAAVSGRWVGADWAPFTCYTLRYTRELVERCAERRPLRLELYGDSIMRERRRAPCYHAHQPPAA